MHDRYTQEQEQDAGPWKSPLQHEPAPVFEHPLSGIVMLALPSRDIEGVLEFLRTQRSLADNRAGAVNDIALTWYNLGIVDGLDQAIAALWQYQQASEGPTG